MKHVMNKTLTATVLGVSIAVMLSGCNNDNDNDNNFQSASPIANNVVEVASKTANLSTLVSAVQFASNNNDLVNTLQRQSNLTVFAPSNAAFEALAAELQVTDENNDGSRNALDLLSAKYRDTVRSVLQYHILNQDLSSADLRTRLNKAITNPNGGLLFVKQIQTNTLQIQDGRNRSTNVETADVDVGNGTVHIIDRVLLPADKTIVATAQATSDLSDLVAALQFASNSNDLVNVLNNAGAYTVFAPTNAAFENLASTLGVTDSNNNGRRFDDLIANPNNKALVRQVLQYHVLGLTDPVRLSGDFSANQTLATSLPDKSLTINADVTGVTDFTGGTSRFVGANSINILASNGAVHLIDRVLLPVAVTAPAATVQ